jgi:hypothetical protein
MSNRNTDNLSSKFRAEDVTFAGAKPSRITTKESWDRLPGANSNELRREAKILRDRAAQCGNASAKHDILLAEIHEHDAEELERQQGLLPDKLSASDQPAIAPTTNRHVGSQAAEPPNTEPPARAWWATQPPGEGWHDTSLNGTQIQLAHCIGVAFHGKRIDVKTLSTMHGKSVWICRVNRTSWQAYFRNSNTLAKANAALIKLQTGTQSGAKRTKRDRKG